MCSLVSAKMRERFCLLKMQLCVALNPVTQVFE